MSGDIVKRLEKQLESDILREICEWLHTKGLFFWRSNNTPMFGKSNDGKMRHRAMPKFAILGVPDIIAIANGTFVGIEVKRPGAYLRPEQKKFNLDCVTNMGKYVVVHSLEEMKTVYADEIEPLFP